MTPEVDDGTWMTKAELAHVRRISIASATRLIRRQGWRRQPGNDGRVRVLVPSDWMHPRHDDPRDDESADPIDQLTSPGDEDAADPRDQIIGPMDTGLLTGAFETALAAIEAAHARELATLREQITSAEAARIGMQAMVEQFAGRLRDADEIMNAERARSDAQIADLQRDLDAAAVDRRAAIALADQSVTLLAEAAARADRAEAVIAAERQRADVLRAQIDVLNAELVATGAEADRAMADERMRADRLNERVDTLSADLTRAEADHRVAEVRADKAETAIAAERARADALRTAIDELKAGQALMADIHARDLAVAQHDAQAGQQAAAKAEQGGEAERERADAINVQLEATQEELAGQRALTEAARQDAQAVQGWAAELRQAEAARKARGRLRRAWDGWRGR